MQTGIVACQQALVSLPRALLAVIGQIKAISLLDEPFKVCRRVERLSGLAAGIFTDISYLSAGEPCIITPNNNQGYALVARFGHL